MWRASRTRWLPVQLAGRPDQLRPRRGDRVWGYRKGKLRFTAVVTPRLARKATLVQAALRAAGVR